MPETAKRSRTPLLLRWLVLNLIRLCGVVAMAWAIGVQVALLIADVRDASNQSTDTTQQYSIDPLNSSLGLGSSTVETLPLISSSIVSIDNSKLGNTLPTPETQSVSAMISQLLRPSDIIDVPDTRLIFASTSSAVLDTPQPTAVLQGMPAALYPDSTPTLSPALPTGGIINLRKRVESPEVGAREAGNVSTVERYFRDSTVPNQTGGLPFAILQRVLVCLALLVLLPGQLGWPERFLIKHLHPLSMRSSGLALGCGKIWIGTDMQRHFVSSAYRLPGLLLLCSGALDVLIAAFLVFQQSQKNKGQLVANCEVYLRYHIAQRFLFWTNVPIEAFYGDDSFGSSRRTTDELEKADDMLRARPYASQYPTFARGGLDDPESQIPDIHGEKSASTHGRRPMETIDEEIEELSEDVLKNTRMNARSSAYLQDPPPQPESKRIPPPQIPAEIAALPESIQKMWKGVQPRFAANQGTTVPHIQLQPSTPSTIASSNQSIKCSRPDTTFSTSSGSSANTDSSTQGRSSMISGSARAFPVPPERGVAQPRSRPKSHLVNRRMDDTRLMPPKKSALRRHSQFAVPMNPRPSSGETEQSKEASDNTQKGREELSRRSFVRFDLHRMSGCSTDSASSADSGLSDILPPKPPMTAGKVISQPAEVCEAMHRSESDSSIYSGIVHEVQRIDTTTATVTKRSASKLASPSRLSYLLTDESSLESPFSDAFAAKPTQEERNRKSGRTAKTVSTVCMSKDNSTGEPARIPPATESPSPDPSSGSDAHDEGNFTEKKKKRMSHIAV